MDLNVFAQLRSILAYLYLDEASSRRIVEDAGLNPARIRFSSHAENNWHAILSEAIRQARVGDLLGRACQEFPENSALRTAVEGFQAFVDQGGQLVLPPQWADGDSVLAQTRGQPPGWVLGAGIVFGTGTLLFLLGLILAGLSGRPVPANSRFPVVVALAVGAALATAFLAGWAAARGQIPIPFARSHSLLFGALAGIAVLLIVTFVGYYSYVLASDASPVQPTPQAGPLDVVYLMDSKEPQQIYNPPGTNTDDIRDILRYMPIKPPIEELVHYEWDDAEIMRQIEPDLIIIHASAFYTTTMTADPAKKLDAFLGEMEGTRTKFLIYSRGADFEDEAGKKRWYETEYPFLDGRVDVLWVPVLEAQSCSHWECSDTRAELRRKVRALLGLP